jgi:hypothetical protein
VPRPAVRCLLEVLRPILVLVYLLRSAASYLCQLPLVPAIVCGVLKLTAVARVYTQTVTLDLKVLTVEERVYTQTVTLDLKVLTVVEV